MSRETLSDLNNNTLIGFADKRGHAWHYRADLQGTEPNHYPGAVPVADVERRLFHWDAVEGQITATALTPDGVVSMVDAERKAIMRSDTGSILGVFKSGYSVHQYREWLLGTVGSILDDSLSIGSAGLLKGGAVAWVQVEVPDSIRTPEGVEFRPNLLACTSHDGSIATTFKRVVTNVVCDNTMAAGLGEIGQTFKVKHSRYSGMKLGDAREALAIVHSTADDFAREVEQLCAITVTDRQWSKFLDSLVPMPDKDGRSKTMAENKRDGLIRLYNHDTRCAPWRGTAWGVVQTVNTALHHEGIVRGESRADRNMLRAVKGETEKNDVETLDTLMAVLA
jgi:phage/plasmid-like protein (TIGR03299 family)